MNDIDGIGEHARRMVAEALNAKEQIALAKFTDYFVRNYPGPDTIIHDPRWHAPKIFRAALAAMKGEKAGWFQQCNVCGREPISGTSRCEEHSK